MRQIITHFTDDDLYKFTMCCAVVANYPRARVKYQFTDRDNSVYPHRFAQRLNEQIAMLENLRITEEEIAFLQHRCPYLPYWFFNYLRGFRYRKEWVVASQDAEGHLSINIEGAWCETIFLEVKLLAIVSELYYEMTGRISSLDYEDYAVRSADKARRLLEAGATFSDFGTRRRASFDAQDTAVRAMAEYAAAHPELPGRMAGTSNVYLAMKYDLVPIGTMAHEFVCAIAGMYGPQMANHLAMKAWSNTFRGALGTFLYDTYGWRIFSLNFSEDYANMFKGLRVDSGDNIEQLEMICDKYTSLGIDPRTKQVVFSNALDTKRAVDLHRYAVTRCLPSFGIGTHFTNDFPDLKPRNIVIKLKAVKITESWTFYNETCKLSEDRGKYTGDPEVVAGFRRTLHL